MHIYSSAVMQTCCDVLTKTLIFIGFVQTIRLHAEWTAEQNVKDVKIKPVLLWWTERLYPHFETEETEIDCKEGSQCLSTTKREYQHKPETIAFLFYGTDLKMEDMPLPRKEHHEWALFHEESPLNNFIFSHDVGINLFNHTATFSSRSDYPLTTQFLPSLLYLTQKLPVPLETKNYYRSKDGLAPILYVQTHCSVPSDRDRYVRELSKFIQIDSYGACLNNKSLPDHLANTSKYDDEEFMTYISRYKFHLAFENAICNDYITEKLFRALHVGSVPIYLGAKTVKNWIPDNNSIIIATDFESPEKLAEYVKFLDANDEDYEKFLIFKSVGITNRNLKSHMEEREWGVNDITRVDFINGFECFVCDRVVARLKAKSTGFSLPSQVANSSHLGCPVPGLSLGTPNDLANDDEWLNQGWVLDYRYSMDLGKALDQMIKDGANSSKNVHEVALAYRQED